MFLAFKKCRKKGDKSLFCSARLHLFYQKYSKNSDIFLLFKIAVFYVNVLILKLCCSKLLSKIGLLLIQKNWIILIPAEGWISGTKI